MAKTEEEVEKIVAAILVGQNEIELVDVEYVKERGRILRVLIDKDGGVGIDDCQNLSEKLEKELDRADIIKEEYSLEVSSPGLERVLKKPRDFEREKGKAVNVSFYAPMDGKKNIVGKLTDFDGETLTLDYKTKIPMEKISQARLHLEI